MRISLKNTVTGKFLGERGRWIENPAEAKSFPDEGQAKDYFTFRRLPNVVVVLLPDVAGGAGATSKPATAPKPDAAAEGVGVKPSVIGTSGRKVAEAGRPAALLTQAEPDTQPVAAKVEAKSEVPPQPSVSVSNVEAKTTTVQANVDVGLGNAVYIRGEGDALSWDRGLPLDCVNGHTWIWSTTHARDKVVFKLLLNDLAWAHGGDLVVEAGGKIEIAPTF